MIRLSHKKFRILQSPARLSIISFAFIICIGTLLLMLPISSADDPMNFTDALFTSTSATCVTGLAIRDTGSEMTWFGQFVILGLIQIGGLGIMTLSTIFLLIAGKRPSMTERILISDTFTYGGERSIREILQDIMMFTFSIEGIGAIILFFRFLPEMHWTKALYYSIFHSVSAFCNAGFSLFSDSFVSFREDWVVNLTICFLIIAGGIGFLVLSELKRYFPFDRKTWVRLSLHSKLVISSTIILLILSTSCILVIEWDNTLTSLSVPGRFLAAFFQAVNVRTAGFNTVAINEMANQTLFIMILMMLIGASPGSCGGGKYSSINSWIPTSVGMTSFRRKPESIMTKNIYTSTYQDDDCQHAGDCGNVTHAGL